jgi:hypothetical protein
MRNWQLATPWGIQLEDTDDSTAAWNAGRLFDALRVGPLPGNPLLVADDASGVWAVNEAAVLPCP